jgi:hypothetical protein
VTFEEIDPTLEIAAFPQSALRIEPRLEGVEPGWLWVFAETRLGDEAAELDEDHGAGGRPFVGVPRDGVVGVTVAGVFGLATAYAGPSEGGVRRVRFAPPPPAVLVLPKDTAPERDWTLLGAKSLQPLLVKHVGTRAEVALPAGGRVWLDAVLTDEEHGDDYLGCAVDVPEQPGGRREVSRETLRAAVPRDVTIALTDGVLTPDPILDIWTPRLIRGDLDHPGRVTVAASRADGGELRAASRALTDGAWVTLDPERSTRAREGHAEERREERWLPFRWRCVGDGPYRFQAPGAALALRIDAPAGARVAVLVDGDLLDLGAMPAEGVIERRIRGVAAGAHTLLVAATGCISRVARLDLRDGETRAATASLGARPGR